MIRGRGVNKTLVRMMIVEEALHHVSPFAWLQENDFTTYICHFSGELDAIYNVKKDGLLSELCILVINIQS